NGRPAASSSSTGSARARRWPPGSPRAPTTPSLPLFNAFEASCAERSVSPDADVVACRFRLPAAAVRQLDHLAGLCLGPREHDMADAFDRFARTLLEAGLAQTPRSVVRRVAHLSEPHRRHMTATDRMVNDRVRWWAAR
ncbi:hypothetical protein, partial [Streptosporangium sp. NPDC048865]|uniref:hypothetical protein n=1 Tax=Streptosporangium sp. NPDC048865 TaxID=3155766 RepID=UPI003440AFD1